MASSTNGETADKSVILVAIDLSPISEAVVRTAATVAGACPSELHVLHVQPSTAQSTAALHLTAIDEMKEKLEKLVGAVPRSVERVIIHVRSGGEAEIEIAQLASDIGADMIVVGTHGHRGIERLLLGSVAEALVRNAPCPVLTYRPKTIPLWARIEPPCPDCVAARQATGRATLWCERHSQHHPRVHLHYEVPPSFGMGSMTFRTT
jgi:nucleotide-binding universal stress UspA family protein